MNQKDLQWFGIKNKSYYNTYGRCINISTGLILGLLIDKGLFILTKGLSLLIPPFAIILMSKGHMITSIRFERTFNGIIEKFISHLI